VVFRFLPFPSLCFSEDFGILHALFPVLLDRGFLDPDSLQGFSSTKPPIPPRVLFPPMTRMGKWFDGEVDVCIVRDLFFQRAPLRTAFFPKEEGFEIPSLLFAFGDIKPD